MAKKNSRNPMNSNENASASRESDFLISPADADFLSVEMPLSYRSTPQSASGSPIKAVNAARYLIHLAASEEEPDFLTHLRLQKLLYYAQGWSLAMRNRALFDEKIEAWAHGPVVPVVYREFKSNGDSPINPALVPPAENLTPDEKAFLESLWSGYKKYSASSLREMTHQHSTWIDARAGLQPGDVCTKEISKPAMKALFKQLLKG